MIRGLRLVFILIFLWMPVVLWAAQPQEFSFASLDGTPIKALYQPNTRLVLLLGDKDDWTPPGPCVEWGQAVGAEVHVYPDSYHDFDNSVGAVKLRSDVPNGIKPGQGVHAGPNPVARETAYVRVRELLRTAFD